MNINNGGGLEWRFWRFSAKNTNILTELGRREARLAFTMCPVELKARSEGTDVAGIGKYFLTTLMRSR